MSDEVVVDMLPACDTHPQLFPEDKDPPKAAVDGKTRFGPWANMCGACYEHVGIGLGTGRGQRLTERACRVCGCTSARACIGGCSWAEPELCSSCTVAIPVITTDAVKEPELRGRRGLMLMNHPYTDDVHSFMIKLEGHAELLQAGSFEFKPAYETPAEIAEAALGWLDDNLKDDPEWQAARAADAHLEAEYEDRHEQH